MHNPFGFATERSIHDARTLSHSELSMSGTPLVKGGFDYQPTDIEHQHNVGICTAISMIQNREKANGKKYSPDFHYLLEKRADMNWDEGSSIFTSLKIAKNYGFLPLEHFTSYISESDRTLPYASYIAKLQSISEADVQRLISLCVDSISGYASVDISDSQAIAHAINESEAGILCRYECGPTWWQPTWLPKDIDPLRKPTVNITGHAIGMVKFDYTTGNMQVLANTWGTQWDKQGTADINYDNYKMTEAWTILRMTPIIPKTVPTVFVKDLKQGMTDIDVRKLQVFLNSKGYEVTVSGQETTFFGDKTFSALKKFQMDNGIPSTGFFGSLSRAKINSMV